MTPVDTIFDIFEKRGAREYGGERVTQLAHALQSAMLSERAGDPPQLIVASLLHDIGHLVHDLGEEPALRGIDDRHEVLGREWLGQYFVDAVAGPVRLHVDAKRYLCTVEQGYFDILSEGSVRSLNLQGGRMAPDEVKAFEALPHAAAAVKLRRYDDEAKVVGLPTPGLEHFRPAMEASLRRA